MPVRCNKIRSDLFRHVSDSQEPPNGHRPETSLLRWEKADWLNEYRPDCWALDLDGVRVLHNLGLQWLLFQLEARKNKGAERQKFTHEQFLFSFSLFEMMVVVAIF